MPEGRAAAAIGPYRVTGSLGAGGMGEVLLAYDPRLDRQVAIKRIRPGRASSPRGRSRFLREARMVARLAHPNIVQVFDLLSQDGAEHIVMEHVGGTSLRQELRSGAPHPRRIIRLARKIARGLSYAHRRGIVHRDLKSENVLVSPAGEVKIADFGIARRWWPDASGSDSRSLTGEGAVVGTVRAMSPEQVQGEEAGPPSDLFALGVLLYELSTGRSPFEGPTAAATVTRILEHRPPPPISLNPRIPLGLSALVEHLLEKEPPLRPRDGDEVVDRLEAIELPQGESTAGPILDPSSRLHPDGASASSGRRVGRWAWAAAQALFLAAALAWWVLRATAPIPPGRPAAIAVAVVEPVVEAPSEVEDLAFLVRSALLKQLSRVDGVYPKERREMDGIEGSSRQVGRAVAADEVVETTLHCQELACRLEVGIVDLSTGRLRWLDNAEIPRDEPLVAARAVQVLVASAYRDRPSSDASLADVRREDFATYLEIHHAFASGLPQKALKAARERLAGLRKRSPSFVDAYLLEAEISLQLHHETSDGAFLEEAVELGSLAQSLAPERSEVLFLRLRLDLAAGRLDQAEERLSRLRALAPGDPELLHHRVELLFARGDLQGAFALARRNAQRHPSWRNLYRYAALASRLGKLDLAREVLSGVLERIPEHHDAMELLARIEMIDGRLERAAALYEALVRRGAGPIELGNLGNLLLLLGRPAAAAKTFRRLLEVTPSDPRSLLNLADARALAGEAAEAQGLYRRVLEELEAHPPAVESQSLTVRSQALVHLGRTQEAVAAAHEALRRAPEDSHVAYEAALVFTLAGERNSALVTFDQAMKLGFDRVWFRYPWFEPLRSNADFEHRVWGG